MTKKKNTKTQTPRSYACLGCDIMFKSRAKSRPACPKCKSRRHIYRQVITMNKKN